MATLAPSAARRRPIPLPMPREPPVVRATLPACVFSKLVGLLIGATLTGISCSAVFMCWLPGWIRVGDCSAVFMCSLPSWSLVEDCSAVFVFRRCGRRGSFLHVVYLWLSAGVLQ